MQFLRTTQYRTQNIMSDFDGGLQRVYIHAQPLGIILQDGVRFPLINLKPMRDGLLIRIVETVFLEGARLQPADHFVAMVRRPQGNQLHDFDVLIEHPRLMDVARDAVQHQHGALGRNPPV